MGISLSLNETSPIQQFALMRSLQCNYMTFPKSNNWQNSGKTQAKTGKSILDSGQIALACTLTCR